MIPLDPSPEPEPVMQGTVSSSVRERPILFSGEMVRAILDGRKTQTRRVVEKLRGEGGKANHAYFAQHCDTDKQDWQTNRAAAVKMWCPYGAVGDRLWVRETHVLLTDSFGLRPAVRYDADAEIRWGVPMPDGLTVYNASVPEVWKRRPSIFMLRQHSRLTLEITDVRVERVQEISEADAIAEGVTAPWMGSDRWDYRGPRNHREAYQLLWDSLNAKRGYSWESNPWVWVLSFRLPA